MFEIKSSFKYKKNLEVDNYLIVIQTTFIYQLLKSAILVVN